MVEIKIFLSCDVCQQETQITLEVLEQEVTNNTPTIQKPIRCVCGQLYLITVPSSWDAHPLVLGENDFLGYREGIPVMRGKKL